MAEIKLTYNSTDYKVVCRSLTAGWKNNTNAKPEANGTSVAEVQSQSFENPTYALQQVQLTEESGTLDYDTLIDMARHKYDGTNAITLTVDYGLGNTKTLVGSDKSSPIKVVIKSFDVNLPSADVYENNSGDRFNMPTLTIVLQETA